MDSEGAGIWDSGTAPWDTCNSAASCAIPYLVYAVASSMVDRGMWHCVGFGKGSLLLWFIHILPLTPLPIPLLSIPCLHPLSAQFSF